MKQKILALTRCLRVRSKSDQQFHFKGVYSGHIIKEIRVIAAMEEFTVGEDYLLYLEVKKIDHCVLESRCLAAKKL